MLGFGDLRVVQEFVAEQFEDNMKVQRGTLYCCGDLVFHCDTLRYERYEGTGLSIRI